MLRTTLFVASLVLLLPLTAAAQRDAGSKALGQVDSFWTSYHHQSHAYDHARVLRRFADTAPTVGREYLAPHIEMVRAHSQAAVKGLARLKELNPDNVAVHKHVESLQAHHDAVVAASNKLDEASKNGQAASSEVKAYSQTLFKELSAANVEAEKLRQVLKLEPLTEDAPRNP